MQVNSYIPDPLERRHLRGRLDITNAEDRNYTALENTKVLLLH